MERFIDKDTAKRIQAIAVLMMVFPHTFGFSERILPGISYLGVPFGGTTIEVFLGSMCKICVSLFAFGTGYRLAKKRYLYRMP